MRSIKELSDLFFMNLKSFNSTNFKTLETADLSKESPIVYKAFSSALTRYFIFIEKHPEITPLENKILFFKLKLDQVGQYFSEYPEGSLSNLVAFQVELKNYVKEHKETLEVESAERPEQVTA